MANLLRGNAYKMVLPYIQRDRIDLASTDELWEVLDGAYDDPDRKGTAKRELENLKQANREFSVYFADFQRLMAELRWDDDARKTALLSRSAVGQVAVTGSVAPRCFKWLSVVGFGCGCAISPIRRDCRFHGSHGSGARGGSVGQYIRL